MLKQIVCVGLGRIYWSGFLLPWVSPCGNVMIDDLERTEWIKWINLLFSLNQRCDKTEELGTFISRGAFNVKLMHCSLPIFLILFLKVKMESVLYQHTDCNRIYPTRNAFLSRIFSTLQNVCVKKERDKPPHVTKSNIYLWSLVD